ncbi:hypothetical protein J6590_003214 [Homalodisca vitripennis]|nr:hypothetical protein J6590_003214 [Homalodisca vitripennis]
MVINSPYMKVLVSSRGQCKSTTDLNKKSPPNLKRVKLNRIAYSIPLFQVLVGNERQDCPLPVTFSEEEYHQLTETAKQLNLEVNLVHQCYQQNGPEFNLIDERQPASSEVFSKAFNILRAVAQELASRNPSVTFPQLLRSAIEHQFHTALGNSSS